MSDAVGQMLTALGILILLGLGMWAITELAWDAADRRPHCTHCGRVITGRPVYAANVEFWRGRQAEPYCTQDCVSAEAEERETP